jgi:maleate isomerase
MNDQINATNRHVEDPDSTIRIGVLTPHAVTGPEVEFPAMADRRLMTCVARVSAESAAARAGARPTTPSGLRALAASSFLDQAAEMFGRDDVAVIAFASTSSGYAIGSADEAALALRLSGRIGIPVVTTCASAVQALRVLDVERIAVVHPPWFDRELNALGAAYFRCEDFHVVSSASAAVSPDPDAIDPDEVYEWTSRHVGDDAEAVFIGGNGFRVAAAIAPLEAAIDRPVLTANQVLLWSLFARAGISFEISGYGRLFLRRPPAAHTMHERPVTTGALAEDRR